MASAKSEIIKALGGKSCDLCKEAFAQDDLFDVSQDMGGEFGASRRVGSCAECAMKVERRNADLLRERREREEGLRQEQEWAAKQVQPNRQAYRQAYAEHESEINEAMRMWNATDFEVD